MEKKYIITESDLKVLVELLRGENWINEEIEVYEQANILNIEVEGYNMSFVEQE